MVQFTLGCVLMALSLFFGAKEIMSNNDIIANRESQLQSEERRVESSKAIKARFESQKQDTISYSVELKDNLMNQLNVDDKIYDFTLEESNEKGQAITVHKYIIQGYNDYGKVFSLISEVEKIKGLFINKVCLGCKLETKKQKRELTDVSFKIEGNAYVYNEK